MTRFTIVSYCDNPQCNCLDHAGVIVGNADTLEAAAEIVKDHGLYPRTVIEVDESKVTV